MWWVWILITIIFLAILIAMVIVFMKLTSTILSLKPVVSPVREKSASFSIQWDQGWKIKDQDGNSILALPNMEIEEPDACPQGYHTERVYTGSGIQYLCVET